MASKGDIQATRSIAAAGATANYCCTTNKTNGDGIIITASDGVGAGMF
jgi:hypothetical protein